METFARYRSIPPIALAGGLLLTLSITMALPAYGQVVTRFTYDTGDQLTSIIDPRGLVTRYAYDGLGQKWQQGSPDTGTTTYNYDTYGRLANMTRAGGNQVSYGYDGLGRRTSVNAGGVTQTFTYDNCPHGMGRLCAASDPTGQTNYVYTPEGRIAWRGFVIGSTNYVLGYNYNVLGQLTSLQYPDGNQALYTYTRGAVSAVQMNINGAVLNVATGITYQPNNVAMAQWTSSNGLTNALTYDANGRLTSINVPWIQNLDLSYDTDDRITAISNGGDPAISATFGYDAMSRLTSVRSASDNEDLAYDANGNRTSQQLNGTSANVATSASSNQQTGLSVGVNTSYGYDARGNLTTVNGVATFAYDPFNRLQTAGTASYYVSPEGQRLRKTVTGASTYFAPDAGGPLLAESWAGGWNDYVWLNGRLVARVVNGQLQAIHDDQVGRPEVITDANRKVVWRARNFAFDRTVTVANPVPLNLGFPGQYYDAESGLWNNGFRDYSPGKGGYIEVDPLGLAAGINPYAYVNNNPLNHLDPFGLWSFSLEAYAGFGGAITFGRDPTTSEWFHGGRLGVGLSVGGSVDPKGARPGADGKDCDHATTLGVFEQGNYTAGVVGGNLFQAAAGIYLDDSKREYFDPPGPSDHLQFNRYGIGLGYSVGLEVIGH
ncbi:putative deoxyribonuclease RhsC [Dyella sp. AD56]|uniref:RHS repeat-associated core domain-containing protein n=1 Tax=Dyella sp. AD56 TaxID=1528744 RepID=UPI000CC53F2F|nr:RHS repeat-associated core domain-containing protein [Dyella sp. AD56]PMQ04533.1 putative deoxyribonuclease RhsC [Dyella sp. AD56]